MIGILTVCKFEPSSRRSSPKETNSGWSHKFMSVPHTVWLFTVCCVSLNQPNPASMSFTIKHDIFPCTRTTSPARRYLCRMSLPGSPALSSSSSPALVTMGIIPNFLHASSKLNVFPHPLPPQIPKIKGTFGLLGCTAHMKFLHTCKATFSRNCSGTK